MEFLSDDRELELMVRKVTAKAGKDDQRFVKIEFGTQIYDGLAGVFPSWLKKGHTTIREVATGCSAVTFARSIESQNIAFRALPEKESKASVFDLEAVDLEEFEIERIEGVLWLRFSITTTMTKAIWDFLWRFYAKAVWAEISECQTELPVAPEKGKAEQRVQ